MKLLDHICHSLMLVLPSVALLWVIIQLIAMLLVPYLVAAFNLN